MRWTSILLNICLLAPAMALAPTPQTKPIIEFADRNAAAVAIVDDRAEPYFSLLQPNEIAVKCGVKTEGISLEALRQEARKAYQAKVMAFTPAEIQALKWVVNDLHPALAKRYPLFARTPWRFLKVAMDLEGGLPHTRGGYIILSPLVLEDLVTLHKKGRRDTLRGYIGAVCVHEQVHVLQRAHPQLFASFITDILKFQRAPQIARNAWLEARNLVNPDATETGWIYPTGDDVARRYLWPLLILAGDELTQQMPRDLRMVGVEVEPESAGFKPLLDEQGQPLLKNLADIPVYAKAFPDPNETYHPHEITASLFTAFFTAEYLTPQPQRKPKVEALKPWASAKAWMKTNFR